MKRKLLVSFRRGSCDGLSWKVIGLDELSSEFQGTMSPETFQL